VQTRQAQHESDRQQEKAYKSCPLHRTVVSGLSSTAGHLAVCITVPGRAVAPVPLGDLLTADTDEHGGSPARWKRALPGASRWPTDHERLTTLLSLVRDPPNLIPAVFRNKQGAVGKLEQTHRPSPDFTLVGSQHKPGQKVFWSA
jgi:hypothetical protein